MSQYFDRTPIPMGGKSGHLCRIAGVSCPRNTFRYHRRMPIRTNAAAPLTVPSEELEAAVDAVVALCEGDQRAALRALVAANDYLNAEVERLQELISKGYARGQRLGRVGA
jgi:hypothetical protein